MQKSHSYLAYTPAAPFHTGTYLTLTTLHQNRRSGRISQQYVNAFNYHYRSFFTTLKSNIFLTHSPTPTSKNQLTTFEDFWEKDHQAPGHISTLYLMKLTKSLPHPPSYVSKWKSVLNITVEPGDWTDIWLATCSVNSLEATCKVVSCWYLVPARISKFVLNYPP